MTFHVPTIPISGAILPLTARAQKRRLAAMQRGVRKFIGAIASLFVVSCTFSAPAVVYVSVSIFTGLSPDPAHIVAGDAVVWYDGDGFGPYTIFGFGPPFDTTGGIRFLQPGSYQYSDDVGDQGTVIVSPDIPPSVTITNPATNAVFTAPATFDFAADATDPDDGVSDVEFYIGTNIVDDVFFTPYTTGITNLPAGAYVLTVIAYDTVGATATNSINITVQGTVPIQLLSPTVTSGQFRFSAVGLTIGKTNVLYASTNLASINWIPIATNVATGNSATFTNPVSAGRRFFRLLQLP
jgi:hypothetical protein